MDIFELLCRLFAGCAPRVVWITAGSTLFFGAYDFVHRVLGTVRKLDEYVEETDKNEFVQEPFEEQQQS